MQSTQRLRSCEDMEEGAYCKLVRPLLGPTGRHRGGGRVPGRRPQCQMRSRQSCWPRRSHATSFPRCREHQRDSCPQSCRRPCSQARGITRRAGEQVGCCAGCCMQPDARDGKWKPARLDFGRRRYATELRRGGQRGAGCSQRRVIHDTRRDRQQGVSAYYQLSGGALLRYIPSDQTLLTLKYPSRPGVWRAASGADAGEQLVALRGLDVLARPARPRARGYPVGRGCRDRVDVRIQPPATPSQARRRRCCVPPKGRAGESASSPPAPLLSVHIPKSRCAGATHSASGGRPRDIRPSDRG